GCTVVYATSEPSEALLLSGHTATLHEGRITQYGETARVYRQPADLRSARVFSDPPINTARVTKTGDRFNLDERAGWQAEGPRKALQDGSYIVAVRPHNVSLVKSGHHSIRVEGKVLVTELSGSESIVHFDVDGQTWISQSHGVHALQTGSASGFFIDVDQCLYFSVDDEMIAGC
ncbi:MAG: hypothetical protein ACC642_04410, partial [Pseudomonadales bacterium]